MLVVAAFFLVSAETYLATYARGVFKMAVAGIGPTELRILLAAGALALTIKPTVNILGLGPMLLWDVGGLAGAFGMTLAFIASSSRNARALYLEETMPFAARGHHYGTVSPVARMPLNTGCTIDCSTCLCNASFINGLGANAPIPPVFGPRSSSKIRL